MVILEFGILFGEMMNQLELLIGIMSYRQNQNMMFFMLWNTQRLLEMTKLALNGTTFPKYQIENTG